MVEQKKSLQTISLTMYGCMAKVYVFRDKYACG